jgi:hypothetical protein
MIQAISITEAIAPIADPVAWRAGSKNLAMIRELAEGALVFKRSFPDVAAVIEGALDAELGRDMPGAGFARERAARPTMPPPTDSPEATGPGASLVPPEGLRRAGAKAFPGRDM